MLLLQSMSLGEDALQYTAKRESRKQGTFQLFGRYPISSNFAETDLHALELMSSSDITGLGVPCTTSGDGNCLFNAVSLALSGGEDFSTELRLRTALEMILNSTRYTSRPDYNRLLLVSPSYRESTKDCCSDHSFSSVWTMMALSNTIGLPIQSVYPRVNGQGDEVHRILTQTFMPDNHTEVEPLTILWTRQTASQQSTWVANHFVPVLQEDHLSTDTQGDDSIFNDTLQTQYHVVNQSGTSFKITTIKTNTEHNDSFQPTAMSTPSRDSCNMASTSHDNRDSATTTPPHNTYKDASNLDISSPNESITREPEILPTAVGISPLPNGHPLPVEDVYTQIVQRQTVLPSVPPGDKSDSYMLVDNTRNTERLERKQRCEFYDDCGAWDSKKGNTVKSSYIAIDNRLKSVVLKNDLFCTERRSQGKKTWEPVSPQPALSQVITLSRYYTVSKTEPSFKKRVTYLLQEGNASLSHVALYEYIGKQPTNILPHGLSKETTPFIRTKPETIDKVKQKLVDRSKKPKEVYAELKADDSLSGVRDFKVIRDIKHLEKKKEKKTTTTTRQNVADEILEVISMLNTHPFVQTITHNKDQVPSIICYTEEQIEDLKHFLKHPHSDPLGIDRTFNLGSFYATIIVYKNQRLIRKDTKQQPVFLGPLMLHKDASYTTYKTFLDRIATKLDQNIDEIEVRLSQQVSIGSDDEKALTKAIDHAFPNTRRLLCTKHLQDNVKHHLQNKIGKGKGERNVIMAGIFKEGNGIIDSNSSFEFEERSNKLLEKTEIQFPAFTNYYEKHLKSKLHDHVFKPRHENNNQDRMWTNNNTESINNIIKLSTHWQPQNTSDLVEKLYNITRLHFMDYRSALHSCGNYRLREEDKHYLVSDQVWRCKSEEEKVTMFRAFLRDTKRRKTPNLISSQDGKYSVISKAQGTAKKPGQRKRPVNERTRAFNK